MPVISTAVVTFITRNRPPRSWQSKTALEFSTRAPPPPPPPPPPLPPPTRVSFSKGTHSPDSLQSFVYVPAATNTIATVARAPPLADVDGDIITADSDAHGVAETVQLLPFKSEPVSTDT